jgi:hypothetical protein
MSAIRIYKLFFTLKDNKLYQALRQAVRNKDNVSIVVNGKSYDIDRLAQVGYDIEEIEHE